MDIDALPAKLIEQDPLEAAPVPEEGDAAADRSRLRAMFQENFAFIWRMLRRMGVPVASVDDAAQEVFCVATRKIRDIAPSSERAFLFSTALRIAAQARRGLASNREEGDAALGGAADRAPGPEQLAERKQALEALDDILQAMPTELRSVFVLFELEGMSTHDIAPLLGLPRGTVASRLRRARDEFHTIAKRVRAKAGVRRGAS